MSAPHASEAPVAPRTLVERMADRATRAIARSIQDPAERERANRDMINNEAEAAAAQKTTFGGPARQYGHWATDVATTPLRRDQERRGMYDVANPFEKMLKDMDARQARRAELGL